MIVIGLFAACPVTWAVCAFLMSTVAFDRRPIQAGMFIAVVSLIVGMIFLSEFCGPVGRKIAEVSGVLLVIATIVTTLILFRKAVRKNLLPAFVLPMAIGILAVTAAVTMMGPGNKPAAGLYLIMTSLLLLPLPALPLAITDSRHR